MLLLSSCNTYKAYVLSPFLEENEDFLGNVMLQNITDHNLCTSVCPESIGK